MTILTMAIADAIAIAALCTLYMVRHRNRELMISYAFGLMATLVALIAILDSRSTPISTDQTQTVTADRAISDEEELKAYLSARLGYTVTSLKITELDMVNNLTRATVTYQPKETTEGGTHAAVEAAQAHVAPISAVAHPAAPQMTATRQPVAPTAEAHATLDTRMIPLQRTPVGK